MSARESHLQWLKIPSFFSYKKNPKNRHTLKQTNKEIPEKHVLQ
jgi:hypothetical protein